MHVFFKLYCYEKRKWSQACKPGADNLESVPFRTTRKISRKLSIRKSTIPPRERFERRNLWHEKSTASVFYRWHPEVIWNIEISKLQFFSKLWLCIFCGTCFLRNVEPEFLRVECAVFPPSTAIELQLWTMKLLDCKYVETSRNVVLHLLRTSLQLCIGNKNGRDIKRL